MAQYEPIPPPRVDKLEDLLLYIVQELREISKALEGVESIILPKLHVEPEKKVEGMLALVDGDDWDPGSGQGVYRWNGTAWVYLG